MKTIYKYPLQITDIQTIEIPHGFVPLSVQVQGTTPVLWAIVDTLNNLACVEFTTVGTGHELPTRYSYGAYVGTYQLGAFVGHVFQGTITDSRQ